MTTDHYRLQTLMERVYQPADQAVALTVGILDEAS